MATRIDITHATTFADAVRSLGDRGGDHHVRFQQGGARKPALQARGERPSGAMAPTPWVLLGRHPAGCHQRRSTFGGVTSSILRALIRQGRPND